MNILARVLVLAMPIVVGACSPSAPTQGSSFAPETSPAATTGALATIEPTPGPTPGPTVYHGTGIISFGTNYDHSTGEVINPKTTFDRFAKWLAYSARFSEEPGALKVTLTIARRSGSSERLVYREVFNLSKPTVHGLSGRNNWPELLGYRAGTYVMRFVRGGTILAEGRFRLE